MKARVKRKDIKLNGNLASWCVMVAVMTYDRKQLSELNFIIQQEKLSSKDVTAAQNKSIKEVTK